jgi:transcriptional regulator with XRE-family HTH domain
MIPVIIRFSSSFLFGNSMKGNRIEEGPMPSSELGRKIKDLRKKKGWSLDELASRGEVSKSYLWELENRETASRPSAEKITKIAVALDVTPEYLIDDRRTEATVDERDKAFFRRYQGASEDVKAKIDQILKLLDE